MIRRERTYRFRLRDHTTQESRGTDMAQAFTRLGLPAALLLDYQDVTPKRARTQERIRQDRKSVA